MKKNQLIAIVLMSPIFWASSGCDKFEDFGDTNVNPGATTSPIIGALLTNVQAGIGGFASETRPGLYGQYFSETQYTDVSLYALPQLNFAGTYSGSLYDLQNIININSSNNMSAVARILQQYIFWNLTDKWGDLPYSEALSGNPSPKFDTQEEIYKGMIAHLTTAVDQFDNTSVITGDIIYNGNADSWKRAANSMRLLMALQLSKVYPGASDYAATEVKAALAHSAGVITTNSQNMSLNYPGGNFKHPWFNTYNGRKDFAESEPMVDLLEGLNDNRQSVFGSSNVGMPYGLTRAKSEAFTAANPNWSYVLTPSYRDEAELQVIIGAAHVSLARAEAADYGWTTENMQQLYQDGIRLSFQQWGLAEPAAGYFTQADVALTAAAGSGANLRKIATQRYIAGYPDGMQAWNIWRKTGFPVLTPAPDATNSSKQIPRRYTYGQNEYATNPENTQAAADRIAGGDTQDSRVWWDKP